MIVHGKFGPLEKGEGKTPVRRVRLDAVSLAAKI